MLTIAPHATLKPFVQQLWVSHSHAVPPGTREHVLPTGQMHLVFRLSGPPLRTFRDAGDLAGSSFNGPVVGGARASFYVKEIGEPVLSVGVQLLPGAALALFGVSAAELAGRHTPASELLGTQADSMLQQLCEQEGPAQQLMRLESLLAARLPRVHGLHPGVADILGKFEHAARVEEMVRESRYSHRGFIALFKQATGLSPKRYARLMRFQQLMEALRGSSAASLSELALACGYSDQAHMNREFREFAGVTPLQYRLLAPAAAHHVALAGQFSSIPASRRAVKSAHQPPGDPHDP
jgi:AraC-like DNA-binding protein